MPQQSTNATNKWVFPVEREFKVADKLFGSMTLVADSMYIEDEVSTMQMRINTQKR